jgi:hypothetical protein
MATISNSDWIYTSGVTTVSGTGQFELFTAPTGKTAIVGRICSNTSSTLDTFYLTVKRKARGTGTVAGSWTVGASASAPAECFYCLNNSTIESMDNADVLPPELRDGTTMAKWDCLVDGEKLGVDLTDVGPGAQSQTKVFWEYWYK